MRAQDQFSDGFSTYLFGLFLNYHGGELHSVDLDAQNCLFAIEWTQAFPGRVTVHHGHSHEWLRSYQGRPIDLLYLDSADLWTEGYQECCLEEARLALPRLSSTAAILVDDSPWSCGKFLGKGARAVPYLLDHGWKVAYAGYQVLLVRG
jgi:hypothetical protein